MAKKDNSTGAVERFSVYIPRIPGQKEQDDVILTVNGETIQIQRGAEVEITRKFFDALQRWLRANDYADDYIRTSAIR